MTQTITPQYASLNRRLMAAIIDLLLILIITTPITNWLLSFFPGGGDIFSLMFSYLETHKNDTIQISGLIQHLEAHNAITSYILSQAISFSMVMAYCIMFWSWQGATPGKMLLRMKVVDMASGGSVTIRQATLRAFGYILSSITLCLGFIMINFRKDCRGLHDILSGTAVIVQDSR